MALFFCLRGDIPCTANRQSVSAACFLSLCCYPVPEDDCALALHLPFVLPARPYRFSIGRYPSHQFFPVRRGVYKYPAEEIQALKDCHGYTHGILMLVIIILFDINISRYSHGEIVHREGGPHGLTDSIVFFTVEVQDPHVIFQDAETGLISCILCIKEADYVIPIKNHTYRTYKYFCM